MPTRIVLFFLSFLFMLSACKKESDEDRIKGIIRAAIAAGNEKKVGDVFEHAAPNFKGPGNSDLQDARRILLGWFMQNQVLRAFEQALLVEVREGEATAKLDLAIVKNRDVKSLDDLKNTDFDLILFELSMTKMEDGWKIHTVKQRHE